MQSSKEQQLISIKFVVRWRDSPNSNPIKFSWSWQNC